jgi:hypothetical protein
MRDSPFLADGDECATQETPLTKVMTGVANCVRKQAQRVVRDIIPKLEHQSWTVWNKGVRNGLVASWEEDVSRLAARLLKVPRSFSQKLPPLD